MAWSTGLLAQTSTTLSTFAGRIASTTRWPSSTAGAVLEQVYLDTRRTLALRGQGGARVKIKQVVLASAAVEEQTEDALICRCAWTATGSVGHWGHLHQRSNRYVARLELRPIHGRWKITGIELLEEERL